MQGEKSSRKRKQSNGCRRKNNRFKKLKFKKERKTKKKNSTELPKPNEEAEVYNSNKKCD